MSLWRAFESVSYVLGAWGLAIMGFIAFVRFMNWG